MSNDYATTMSRLPDSELLKIIENPESIAPEALLAAKNEWTSRGIDESHKDEIRQRRKNVERMHRRTLPVPSVITGLYNKYFGHSNSQQPQFKLFTWLVIITFFFALYAFVKSLFISSGSYVSFLISAEASTFGWFDTISIVIYFGILGAILVGIIQLLFLKKWAYWITTIILTYGITVQVLTFATNTYDTWIYYSGAFYTGQSLFSLPSVISTITTGVDNLCGLLLLYLLSHNNIRESFKISSTTFNRILITGLIPGIISGAFEIYFWWDNLKFTQQYY